MSSNLSEEMLDAPQVKLLMLFHYINMLTYCVGYKHCYMFNAE